MKLSSTMPAWAQWVLGIFLSGAVLFAGGATMAMNVIFGLQYSLILGVIFGFADLLKVAMPAVAIFVGWRWEIKTIRYSAVIFSIFCALNHLAETQGNAMLGSQHRSAMIERAEQEATTLQGQIDQIDEVLGSQELGALHQQKLDAVSRETGRGGCGKTCEALQVEADALLVRLGKAKRREQLETTVAEAVKTLKATPEKTIGSVAVIVYLTGIDKSSVSTTITIVSSLFALFLLEVTALLSGYAMTILRNAYAASKTKPVKTSAHHAETLDAIDEPGKMTKEIALHKMQMKIFHSPGKMLVSSRRALAEELGVAKSTFNDWCNEWQTAGLVITSKRGNDTVFAAQDAA